MSPTSVASSTVVHLIQGGRTTGACESDRAKTACGAALMCVSLSSERRARWHEVSDGGVVSSGPVLVIESNQALPVGYAPCMKCGRKVPRWQPEVSDADGEK